MPDQTYCGIEWSMVPAHNSTGGRESNLDRVITLTSEVLFLVDLLLANHEVEVVPPGESPDHRLSVTVH